MADALRVDPSRTTMLRYRFLMDAVRRIKALTQAITQKVDVDDCFAIRNPTFVNVRDFVFHTDEQKIAAFRAWLQQQFDHGLLYRDPLENADWTSPYVFSAYRKGIVDAYLDTKRGAGGSKDFQAGSQAEFLRTAFNAPETLSKLQMLYTRSYANLEGITAQMDADISRILTGAVAHGKGPREIAKALNEAVDGLGMRRAKLLAQTEVIHSLAEGQLDSYERLGVEELGIEAEFTTRKDGKVCPICLAKAGKIYTIAEARGVIPQHPGCRCVWKAYIPGLRNRKRVG